MNKPSRLLGFHGGQYNLLDSAAHWYQAFESNVLSVTSPVIGDVWGDKFMRN